MISTESLVNLPNAAFEGIIFLIGKQLATVKLHLQGVDGIHGVLIGGTEWLFFGYLRDTRQK